MLTIILTSSTLFTEAECVNQTHSLLIHLVSLASLLWGSPDYTSQG